MANNLKHVGRIKATGRKVIVAYRTLPGESDSALIVDTVTLSDDQHDSIIKLVESQAGQSSYEFAEAMARTNFPDGSIMLANLHFNSKLIKVKTSEVEMTPTLQSIISLDQLNQLIAEQRGISVNDLALGNGSEATEVATVKEVPQPSKTSTVSETQTAKVSNEPLTDEDLARSYRSQADRLSKEAAELRRQAEALVPTKKKATAEV
jgi:hypothetical protein